MHINQQFGIYTIVEIIGEGGMGTVGKALDGHGKEYAIKQIRAQIMNHSDALARFEREKRIQSVLKHPNLLPLIDSGSNDGMPYFVMPYVEGISLSQRLKRGALKNRQGHVVVRDIGNALAFAHSQNILHRDIKPGNIILHPEGRAYLADFGIATDPAPNPSLRTSTINIASMGTSDYMAPEVLRGQRSTPQSEVYSFGVTIYEMLTGERYTSALGRYQDPWYMLAPDLAHVLERSIHVSTATRYPTIESFTADCVVILSRLSEPYRRRPAFTTFINPRRQIKNEFFDITEKEAPQTASGINPLIIIAGTILAIIGILFMMSALANSLSGRSVSNAGATETAIANSFTMEVATSIAGTALAQGITVGQESIVLTAIADQQNTEAVASETVAYIARNSPTSTLISSLISPASTVAPGDITVGTILFTQRETTVGAVAGASNRSDIIVPANTRIMVSLHPNENNFEFGGHYHVTASSQGFTGWVDASDLAPNPPPPGTNATEANEPRPAHQRFVAGQAVFINSAELSGGVVYLQPGPIVTTFDNPIEPGSVVLILSGEPEYQTFSDGGGLWWWRIELVDGTRGYIEANYLSATPP